MFFSKRQCVVGYINYIFSVKCFADKFNSPFVHICYNDWLHKNTMSINYFEVHGERKRLAVTGLLSLDFRYYRGNTLLKGREKHKQPRGKSPVVLPFKLISPPLTFVCTLLFYKNVAILESNVWTEECIQFLCTV